MNTPIDKHPAGPLRPPSALQLLRFLGQAAALPVFVILHLAKPLVRFGLAVLGLLSILLALFYRLVSPPPRSPFWLLLGFGLSCGLALVVYEQVLRLPSNAGASDRH